MGIVLGLLLFLAGMIAGTVAMGLAQSKRVFEIRRLREELGNRLKETEKDWDIPRDDTEGDRFHEVKVYK